MRSIRESGTNPRAPARRIDVGEQARLAQHRIVELLLHGCDRDPVDDAEQDRHRCTEDGRIPGDQPETGAAKEVRALH